jgi:transposase
MYKLDAWDPYSKFVPWEVAMSNPVYIGIDVGKFQLHCSLPQLKPREFANDRDGIQSLLALAVTLAPAEQLWFVMESTGSYSSFTAATLRELAHVQVSIVPAACVNAFKQSGLARTKTDRSDAVAIRKFAEKQQPAPWFPPPAALRRLRSLHLAMENLRGTRARVKCLREKLAAEHQPDQFVLDSLKRQLEFQQQELKRLADEFEAVIGSDPTLATDAANMLSIPHVGPGLRNTILVLCYPQLKELSQRQLLAYCGMSPREHQSGQFKGQTRMSKTGDGRIRKNFYMAALGAVRSDGLMHDYFLRRKAAKDNGKVILSGVMRKLLNLIQGVVRSGTTFDAGIFQTTAC